MMRILDSSVLVDVLRGDEHVRHALHAHDPSALAVPAFVRSELVLGATLADDGHAERYAVEAILRPFRLLAFDERCANAYAVLHTTLQRRGALIGIADIMIAATAIAHDATVVTANVRDFARVPFLRIESWRAA